MMKSALLSGMILILAVCLLSGCTSHTLPSTQPSPSSLQESTTPPTTAMPTEETAEPTTTPTTQPVTVPEHSPLYIPGVSIDDVIVYFNEVCLDAEFVNSGDPTKLQKWEDPIWYQIVGEYKQTDKEVLDTFVSWLNTVEDFPGIQETKEPALANLRIHFYGQAEYLALMGDNFVGTDGGVTFWYNGADEIYYAVIGYRADILQEIRNSVILEEIYNGLGPVNDTLLRSDSVIYSGFSQPQSLSAIDELILKLLYHPQMQCGMDAAACEAVIRQLYY